MNFLSSRSSVPEQIQQDPIEFADRLYSEFKAYRKAHQDETRDLIQKCAFLAASLKDADTFRRLAGHPYWESSRQKPKPDGRGRWGAYLMCRPMDRKERKHFGRYGRVIDTLFAEGVSPEQIADELKARHGMGAILKQLRRMRSGKSATKPDDTRRPKNGSVLNESGKTIENKPHQLKNASARHAEERMPSDHSERNQRRTEIAEQALTHDDLRGLVQLILRNEYAGMLTLRDLLLEMIDKYIFVEAPRSHFEVVTRSDHITIEASVAPDRKFGKDWLRIRAHHIANSDA